MKIGICGTTERTVQCAQAVSDAGFTIHWVVTPPPRPMGRKQILTPSPVEIWAQTNTIPVVHVEKSLKTLQSTLENQPPIDFLLVVDFGYLVPQWLLDLPKIAPINVHPSALPQYRGSSPAQYALLFGETQSAVCIMRMTAGLDEGPIIRSIPFRVEPHDTAESYYRKAFALASQQLAETLQQYAVDRRESPQPKISPTPIARRLTREDGFVPYSLIQRLENGSFEHIMKNMYICTNEAEREKKECLGPVFAEALSSHPNLTVAQLVENAVRAFSPWPGVWTIVPNYKGRQNVRCKIKRAHMEAGRLAIDERQFEGE